MKTAANYDADTLDKTAAYLTDARNDCAKLHTRAILASSAVTLSYCAETDNARRRKLERAKAKIAAAKVAIEQANAILASL